MAYSTLTDIKKQIDEDTLIRLTDDEDAGSVDTDITDEAIAYADADIDARLTGKYTLPLSPVPVKIRQCSVDIAIYNLYSRRETPPENRDLRYKNALAFLEDVRTGAIDLGVSDPAADDDGNPVRVTTDKDDRTFTMDEMESF